MQMWTESEFLLAILHSAHVPQTLISSAQLYVGLVQLRVTILPLKSHHRMGLVEVSSA